MNGDEPYDPPDRGRFPALRSPAFRMLWIGLTVSAIGSKMQDATIRWHIYELTHSLLDLGLIGLCRFVPLFVFSLIGGSIADSLNRRRILLITQSVMAASAAALALLTVTHTITVWSIYAVNALSAGALAFDSPARQSLIPNLVPRRHFSNAASLNSTAFKVATVVGPYIAGMLLQRRQIAVIYGVNAASFLAVLIALFWMRIEEPRTERGRANVNLGTLREGFRFVLSQPIQVWTIALDFSATFFSSMEALLPAFAKDVLHVDARGYGALTAASAAGSVTAGSVMAFRPPVLRQGLTMLVAVAIYGFATLVFGLSHTFVLSLAALAVAGAADTVSSILRQTLRQMSTPDALRGRMTAINMIFFMGGPQLGNLEAGLVANVIGAPLSVITGGIGCLIAVVWIAARAPILRNYRGHIDEPNG